MITLIHGTDVAASRKYFFEEKEKYPDALLLNGEKVTLTELTQLFEGNGLFTEEKTVFIEQLLPRKKQKDEFAVLADYLQKQDNHAIFLWEGKELEKSSLGVFPKALPKNFKLPQTLFLFLDNLKPNNGRQLISLFHQTLEATEAEMIFFMLVRQFRLLLALIETSNESIDEAKRLAPWQKGKLEKQAQAFEKKHLLKLYNDLFQLEVAQKTGKLPHSLTASIDFFLLEI